MQMKLFSASDVTDIGNLEVEINEWLASLATDVEVKHVSTGLAAIPSTSTNRFIPRLVVTVWWDKR
jgi:hypothetical protein